MYFQPCVKNEVIKSYLLSKNFYNYMFLYMKCHVFFNVFCLCHVIFFLRNMISVVNFCQNAVVFLAWLPLLIRKHFATIINYSIHSAANIKTPRKRNTRCIPAGILMSESIPNADSNKSKICTGAILNTHLFITATCKVFQVPIGTTT